MPRIDPGNATRYWRDPRVPGLSLLSADLTTHEYPPHTHDALLIAVTESGGSSVMAGGVPDEIHETALLVVNPADPHASRMDRSRGWRYRSFYLEGAALADVADGLGIHDFPSFDHGVYPGQDLVDRFLRLHQALEGAAGELRRRELFVGAFGALVRRHGGARRPVPLAPRDRVLLRRAVELVRDRHADHLTLPELAAPLGLTQYQLIGLFRRGTGLTPHAYLTQVRLDAARRHLAAGVPIADVALAAGFYDQSALTKHFKRCYGITPRQFARA
jgi:AraC-like DNA-binding protein